MSTPSITHSNILEFWFSDKIRPKHFIKDVNFDQEINDNFLSTYQKAFSNQLDQWNETAEESLALIITLDQFPRNIFRNTTKSFESDEKAREISKIAIEVSAKVF